MSSTITLGDVIFIAVKPILKIYLIIGVGFILVKKNVLTTETSRGISNMVVNALGPALFFNKIITNLSGSKIKDIGVFVLTALAVFGTGFALAVVASFVTPVPQKWRYGLLFAGIFGNISDLPIAYVQGMDTGLIFTAAQGDKAVALTCVLSAVQQFLMMNCGLFQLVGLDFKDDNEDKERAEEKEEKTSTVSSNTSPSFQRQKVETRDETVQPYDEDEAIVTDSENESNQFDVVPLTSAGNQSESGMEDTTAEVAPQSSMHQRRRISSNAYSRRKMSGASFARIRSNDSGYSTRSHRSRAQTIQSIIHEYSEAERIKAIPTIDILARTISVTQEVGLNFDESDAESIIEETKNSRVFKFIQKYRLGWLEFVALNMIRIPSLSIIISFTIAMIPWLRALFVTNSIDMPSAPDDLPPLSFFMDFTSYIANASVPMGLIMLGGTLARLDIEEIPKGFWKTVLFMLVSRLIVMPILGVLWADRLYGANWVTDSVSKFLLIICWGMPSATSQIYFTAFYTPLDGPHPQMDCYALILLAQYPVLVITLPFVVTYTLKVDLGL